MADGANAERVFRCEHGDAGASSYCATKFAVEGITECLAIEVAPLGIHVTVVGPGYFSTEYLSGIPSSTRKKQSTHMLRRRGLHVEQRSLSMEKRPTTRRSWRRHLSRLPCRYAAVALAML
ncbi:SDR family NAD(P)-dependent oxidoreductase [Paraburkholderia phytofirmans]|uniref:SDR family NAD(P)-dependent oxidoreductase n=1 Tax=Paraburkholderia phytofirmans TaxID=261302 RepID=UPI0009ED6072|nr:SDR family NAD(P)-dependent oxidoreductase [Paraburkholderia phytofirmans]